MRRLAVADLLLLLLLLLLSAALLLLLLLLLLVCRRRRRFPELPVSQPNTKKESHRERLRQVLFLALRPCSRFRRTRVEPAASAATSPAPDAQGEEEQLPGPEEDVAAWRGRWFGPASRALYTIHEESLTSSASSSTTSDGDCESEGGAVDREEPETPFYTPPASPPRPHSPEAGAGVDLGATP